MKILLILILSLLSITLGIYVGGAVFLKMTHVPLDYLTIGSLYDNWVQYSYKPSLEVPFKISFSVFIIISCIPIISLIIIFIINRNKVEIHGSARFANDFELSKSGLFIDKKSSLNYPALLLGKMDKGRFKNRFVQMQGQTFVGVSAPTGSGKGVGIVIPNLLNYSDSVVNTDIKLENFIKTAGFRKSQGQEVFLFAPDGYSENESDRVNGILRSHRWNPYFYVRRHKQYRIGDLLILANSLYPLSGDSKSDLWQSSAIKLFLGLSLWMLDTESITMKNPTLPYLLSLLGVDKDFYKWIESELLQSYISDECRQELNTFLGFPKETRGSVLLSFNAPLAIYSDHTVSKAVSENDFDFRDLRRKGISLYVGVQPPNQKRFQGLLNLFYEQLINENTRVTPEIDSSLTHQCLLLLDEFPALGRVNQIKNSIGFTRQYNLRYLFIYQDKSQLEDKELYGKEGADNIISNLSAEVIYPPKIVNNRVKEICETLGTKTVKVKSFTKNYGKNSSKSATTSLQKRELLMPNELVELGHQRYKDTDIGIKTLLFKENQRSFIMNKIIYFDEIEFNKRKDFSSKNIPIIPLLQ